MGCQQSVPSVASPAAPTKTTFTMAEVAKHNTRESLWVVIDGGVYRIPPNFLFQHPGGVGAVLGLAGTDASRTFNSIHSIQAKIRMKEFLIGHVGEQQQLGPAAEKHSKPQGGEKSPEGTEAQPAGPVTLSPHAPISLQLRERIPVSRNTRIFRFALPSPQHRLGLPCGMHVHVSACIAGESVTRPYTPISSDDDLGHLDLLVKVYFPGTSPTHPSGGKMSQHLEGLQVGDELAFQGPIGHFVYEGRGAYQSGKKKGVAKQLSMVAGGTGITPVYAVMQAVLKDPEDTTTMSLLFANSTEDDILLRPQLDALALQHPDRLRVRYVLSRPPEGWRYGSGHINKAILTDHLLPAGPETLALVCGPPGLVDDVCMPGLQAIGYADEAIVRF